MLSFGAGNRYKDECLPGEVAFYASIGRAFLAVSIRTSTERPETMEQGCFTLAGITEKSLLQAVAMHRAGEHGGAVADYGCENVSEKVVRILQSYTPVVNKMVWRKA